MFEKYNNCPFVEKFHELYLNYMYLDIIRYPSYWIQCDSSVHNTTCTRFVITSIFFVYFHKAFLISDPWYSYVNWNPSVKLIISMPDHARRGELRTRIILVKLIWPIDSMYCRLWTGTRIVLSRSLWSLIKGNNFFHNSRFIYLKMFFITLILIVNP